MLFWVIYIIQKPRNYCVGRVKLVTLHALFGNWYDQMYFSFFSNCEEIKLPKAPPEKYRILSCVTLVAKERNVLCHLGKPTVFKIILFKTPKSCHWRVRDGGNVDLQKLYFWALYLCNTDCFWKKFRLLVE